MSLDLGFITNESTLPADGYCYYLWANKTGAMNYDPPFWDGNTYFFSQGDYDYTYFKEVPDEGGGYDENGMVGSYDDDGWHDGTHENWWEYQFPASPIGIMTVYYNPALPTWSKALYNYSSYSTMATHAAANATLNLTGTSKTRYYIADGSYTEDAPVEMTSDARLGLIGVQKGSYGEYVYGQITHGDLPNITNNNTLQKFDVTELVKAYIDSIKPTHDAMAMWPILDGLTVTPGTTVGPEFMLNLFESCYSSTITAGSPPLSYAGTVVTKQYQWTVPILDLSGVARVQMEYSQVSVAERMRVDYVKVPGGIS